MKSRVRAIRLLKRHIRNVRWPTLLLLFINLLATLSSFISPKLFQILIDDVIKGLMVERFWIVALGMVLIYVFDFFASGVKTILSRKIQNTFSVSLKTDALKAVCFAPYSFIEKYSAGDIKMRVLDDTDATSGFVEDQVVNYIISIITLVTTTYLALSISFRMTILCAFFVVPIVILLNFLIGRGTKKVNEEVRKANSDYYTSTFNTLQYWREIKAQNKEEEFFSRFKKHRSVLAKLGIKSIRYWAYGEIFNDFKSNYLTKVLIYVIGTFFVIRNDISVGFLIMFSEYFAAMFSAIDSLHAKRIAMLTNAPYYERVYETLSFPQEENDLSNIAFLSGITTENVCFSYSEESDILKRISLNIEKGNYVAFSGKTGCGKSTLIKLILGLYSPQKGRIMLDDKEISRIKKNDLLKKFGVVMQDNYLFNMTIRENLVLGALDSTEIEMEEACKKANIYDFIMSLPEGFDTEIGERGVRLSGGQRQRISIAAALLRNPEILIFDEATSSLDNVSERIINRSITKLSEEITIIVVTHKPNSSLQANRVFVIENGEIKKTIEKSNYSLNPR